MMVEFSGVLSGNHFLPSALFRLYFLIESAAWTLESNRGGSWWGKLYWPYISKDVALVLNI